MKTKIIALITIVLACIFIGTPIVTAASSPTPLEAPVVSGEFSELSFSVVLYWTEVPGATSYRIYRSESSAGEKEYLGQTDELLYVDSHLRNDAYYYYVRAYNKDTGEEGYYSKVCKVEITAEQLSYIKYSDLFYVYDTWYLDNAYFDDYFDEVYDILNDVNYEYVDSSSKVATDIKTAILASVNWKDWCTLVSDSFFDTSFNYNAALDAANVKFAQSMMDEAWWGQAASELSSFTSKASKLVKIFDKMGMECNVEIMTTQEIYEAYLIYLSEDNCFGYISVTTIQKMKSIDLVDATSKGLKHGGEALKIVQSIAIGMLLEDLRMEMIDRMVKLSPSNSAIHQGMTRLKSQLQNGFVSYFVDNYVKDKVIDTFVDHVVGVFISGEFLKTKGWITFVVNITTKVVFFDTPDMKDLLVQRVLTEYSYDVKQLLSVQREVFNTQFTVEDVEMYALLYNAYVAINNAALKQSKKLADGLDCEQRLKRVTEKYKNVTYETYIDSVKDDISDQNLSDRKCKTYDNWIINGDVKFSFPSDTLAKNTIYLCNSSFYCENTILKGTCTIDAGTSIYLDGNFEISTGTLTISENSIFEVGGNTEIYRTAYGYHGDLYNNGVFKTVSLNCSDNGYYHQTCANAQLIIYGDFSAYSTRCCDITNGVVTFDGTSDQTIENLKAYNLDVCTWGEIEYLSDIHVYGNYNLNGNSLNNNGYYTHLYDGATLSDGSNYKAVYIDSDFILRSNLPCDKVVVRNSISVADGAFDIAGDLYITPVTSYQTFTVTINEDASLKIGGLLKISGKNVCLDNQGYLEVVEFSITSKGTVFNSGILETCSLEVDDHGYYYQDASDAQLILSGKISFYQKNQCAITAGTIIFNGSEQQTVNGVKAYNIEVLNPKGIKYLSSIDVYGNYDLHGNALDDNGHSTVIFDGATFTEGSNYQSVSIGEGTSFTLGSNLNCETLYVHGTLNIPSDAEYWIDANISILQGALNIPEGGHLEVLGDITVSGFSSSYGGSSGRINNSGILEVQGLKVQSYGSYRQEASDAQLILSGNVSFYQKNQCAITAGTIIFNGSEQQTVNGIKAYNIEVLNPEGIKYLSSIDVYGNYDLHGNPLDNNGNSTIVYDGATFAEGSNYQSVSIGEGTSFTLGSNLNCETLYVHGTLNIPSDAEYWIDANISILQGALNIPEGGHLEVLGDITVSGFSSSYGGSSGRINNSGILEIYSLNANDHGYYYQDTSDAQLILSGKISFYTKGSCKITAGTIIFNGSEQQTVNGVKAYNIEVLNPKGIKYLSSIDVYGNYDLHGNALDDNGHSTVIFDGATFTEGSNYQSVSIGEGTSFTLGSNLNCETLSVVGTLNIPADIEYWINASISISQGTLNIPEGGHLEVLGDITVIGYTSSYGGRPGQINNSGILEIYSLNANDHGYYYQDTSDAQLILSGKISFYTKGSCKITAGTIIFNGSEQQTVNGVKAYNIEVLNPKGIKYLSSIDVYGNFDFHGNPVECGNYKTNFYEDGLFGTLECNQSDWIIDDAGSCGQVGSKHIECLVCHEIIQQEDIPISIEHTWIYESCELARTCDVCGAAEDTPLGHDYGSEWIVDVASTCTTIGSKSHHCSRCDDKADITETPATGHSYESVVTGPACTEKGYTTHTCHCGDTYVDSEIDALGHTPSDWIVDTEAQIGVAGSKHKECTICGETLETEVIEALTEAPSTEEPTTAAPITEAPTTEPEPSVGCNGTIGASAALLALLSCFAVSWRPRKDN